MSRVVRALLLGGLVLAVPLTAAAQIMPPGPPRWEVAITVGAIGPVSLGTADATLTTPGGSPLVLFKTENRVAPGAALEVHLGQDVTDRFMVEVTGVLNRADFESRISSDVEDADAETLAQSGTRYAVLGAGVWTFLQRGDLSVFARGGGGWMREVAGTGALVRDGAIVSIGGGMRYWMVDRPGARLRRIGIRVEGRAEIRSAAITLGERRARVAPVVVGGVVFRF